MNKEVYGLITFKSTNFALQAEQIFKENDFKIKTIPTPRDVSTSCGLSLLFIADDINNAIELIKDKSINIDGLYKYTKSIDGNEIERLL